MTGTTKVPEKIWAVFEKHPNPKETEPYVYASSAQTKGTKYIRADLVNELIAAAYEDAAEVAFGSLSNGTGVRDEILAQTPDDARAALAARDQHVREGALREAMAVADATMKKYAAATYSKETIKVFKAGDDQPSQSAAKCYCAGEIYQEIEALITEDQTNG